MESALAEIEFLALSSNRVEVLELLTEDKRSRRELGELTGASQPTLGRILSDFEERTWITRERGGYAATATGRLVADGFTDLLEILETEGKLRNVVQWLPTDAMDFDLRRLSDATITAPTQTRPNAPVQRVLEFLRRSDRALIFSHAFNEQSLEVIQRRTVEEEQTFEGVFSPSAIAAIADDSGLRRRLEELIAADGTEIRISDEEIPIAATIADDRVHLMVRDGSGILRAAIDTDDERIRAWARETHARYWRDARPLDVEALSA